MTTGEVRGNDELVSVRAEELSEEYDSDSSLADEKYLNERLDVTGTILRLDNVVSAVVPRMLGCGEKYSGTHVKFLLDGRDNVDQLTKGQPATIRGTCRGLEESTSPTGERIGWITVDGATVRNRD